MTRTQRLIAHFVYGHRRVDERKLTYAATGKNILVTGASRGIGKAVAHRLATAGAHVVLVARSEHELHSLEEAITADGGRATAIRADLTDFDEVDALVKQVRSHIGRVDVLVNNAGKSIRRRTQESYERFEDHQNLIHINYLGPVRLTLGLLPFMQEDGGGLVVNVGSFAVRLPPWPRWNVYQASKSAFDIWAHGAASELRQEGIRFATVHPGFVDTSMTAPTAHLRRLPPLDVDDAANLVCAAVVSGHGDIGPWWVPLAHGASGLCRGIAGQIATAAHHYLP
jgi:NAD(P)-dependent dehydrogenase (short-subunit alcohol dehydrogenase family)